MTPGQWLGVIAYAVLATVLGRLFLRSLRFAPDALLDDLACAFLCGQMLMTALSLTTGLLPVGLRTVHTLTVIVGALALVWLVRRTPAVERARSWRRIAAALALLAVFPNLIAEVHSWPPQNWDARSIWMFHGKALWYGNGVRPEFFTNPAYHWSNLDYPLHIPAHSAWCAWFTGGWTIVAPKAFLLGNAAAYLRLLWLLLRQRGQPPWLAVGVALALMAQQLPGMHPGEMYVAALADLHYALPLALFALAMSAPAERRSVPFALVMLAFASGVKTEGQTYAAVIAAAAALVVGWRAFFARKLPPLGLWLRTWRRELVLLLVLGGAPFLLWTVFKTVHGITGGLHLFTQVTTPGLLWRNLQERTGLVLEILGDSAWLVGMHWVAIAWAVLWLMTIVLHRLGGPHWRPLRSEVVTMLGVAFCGLAIFGTYLMTPHDVRFHMETSAPRLVLAPQLLLVVLAVMRLDRCVVAMQPPVTASAAPPVVPVPVPAAGRRR